MRVFSALVSAAFFFFLVVAFGSKGADCVCRSATSEASGGAGANASPGAPLAFGFLGSRARALNRVFVVGAAGSSGFAGCSALEAMEAVSGGSAPAFSVDEFVDAFG